MTAREKAIQAFQSPTAEPKTWEQACVQFIMTQYNSGKVFSQSGPSFTVSKYRAVARPIPGARINRWSWWRALYLATKSIAYPFHRYFARRRAINQYCAPLAPAGIEMWKDKDGVFHSRNISK